MPKKQLQIINFKGVGYRIRDENISHLPSCLYDPIKNRYSSPWWTLHKEKTKQKYDILRLHIAKTTENAGKDEELPLPLGPTDNGAGVATQTAQQPEHGPQEDSR